MFDFFFFVLSRSLDSQHFFLFILRRRDNKQTSHTVFISSQKVLKISTLFNMVRVGIIGAGVVGLSTALCIKLQHPSLSLTIIADRFLDATTSDGAGGLFRPDDRYVLGVDKSILRYY